MPKRKLPPNDVVVQEYRAGKSTGEIAERYNVAPVTVVSLLRRLQEPMRSPREAARIREVAGRGAVTKYWEGKTQPPEMVEARISKIRGPNHYLWKGGAHRRSYRNVVTKTSCSNCGAKKNLGVHHVDFDHYSNVPENLTVLCVSCHMSVHKKAYWDAIHDGRTPPISNGPVGWRKEVKDESVLDERRGDVVPD